MLPAEAERAAEAYFNSEQVSAQEFVAALRRLKFQVRHVQRSQER